MEERKEGHLDTQEQGGNAHLDVGCLNVIAGLDGARTGEERNGDGLPEAQENDQLDRSNLEKWFVLADVVLDLYVELDQAVHGDGDGNGLEYHDPDVRKRWTERFKTIQVERLRDDGHNREEDAYETVLEYADPDHLFPS